MIDDIIKKIELHRDRAKLALSEIEEFEELSSDIFEDFEKIKTIDTFIYRFIKFQDMMGDKLFKQFLNELGEYRDSMPLIEVLDKLEKFQIIDNSNSWMEYRKLRNILTHEYPNNESDIIEGIKISIKVFYEIDSTFERVKSYIKNLKEAKDG